MKKSLMMFPFLLSAVVTATAAEERQLGPHVHGQATVDIAVEGAELEVEASLPGHDAVGFEHPPGSDTERAALSKATGLLNEATWFAPATAASCALVSAKVSPHGFGGANELAGGHADIDVAYRFSCNRIARLNAVEITLVKVFPSVQQVTVNLITASGSTRQVLDAAHRWIDVQP